MAQKEKEREGGIPSCVCMAATTPPAPAIIRGKKKEKKKRHLKKWLDCQNVYFGMQKGGEGGRSQATRLAYPTEKRRRGKRGMRLSSGRKGPLFRQDEEDKRVSHPFFSHLPKVEEKKGGYPISQELYA